MPPTLRSAQNSPSGKVVKSDQPATSSPATTPSRKTPQCSHCKRPRAGHPRSGCPYTSSPADRNVDDAIISGALQSLNLKAHEGTMGEEQKPPMPNRRHQPAPLERTRTQLSLTTTSNEILGHLSQSGLFDDQTEGDSHELKGKVIKLVRWEDAVNPTPKVTQPLKSRFPSRSPMPGTLIPPSPFSSFDSVQGEISTQTSVEHACHEQQVPVTPQPAQARPLARSMSAVERDIFIAKLTCETPATVYVVPKADVDSIMKEAKSLKFFTAHITNESDHIDDQALLILGRTESAVQTLLDKIEAEHSKLSMKQHQSKGPGSNYRVMAGSALVGAVGAWAGLAFS
ncbi:hypothetical protein CVT24_005794 [Panaeolus cyanescens]|uniref:Uncharacterized protein n=1 Tax=Panaeolus cyanescens TaxID=181874 RepID=A0A409V934_9AGAR|nr:hypothetical protein CVT24_005794 [Panaeolus cyanescens]